MLLAERAGASVVICSFDVNAPPPAAADYAVVGDSFLSWEGGGRIPLRGSLRLIEAPPRCPPVAWDFKIADLQLQGDGTELSATSGSALLPPVGNSSFSVSIASEVLEQLSESESIVDTTILAVNPALTSLVEYPDLRAALPDHLELELLIHGMRTREYRSPSGSGSSSTIAVATLGSARLDLQRLPDPSGAVLVLLAIIGVFVSRR